MDDPDVPPGNTEGAFPSTAALLFELRELNKLSTSFKFRYSQTADAIQRDRFVRGWKEVHQKKTVLKMICQSCYAREQMLAKKTLPPSPPPQPKFSHWGAIKSALTSSGGKEANCPSPPPRPSWSFRSLLQAAKSALRKASMSREKPAPNIPQPPPPPDWGRADILKETKTKLRSGKLGKVIDQNRVPRQKLLLHQSPVALKMAKSSLRHIKPEGIDPDLSVEPLPSGIPEPPPLPLWTFYGPLPPPSSFSPLSRPCAFTIRLTQMSMKCDFTEL
mmetsp:Transcript_14990/g.20963  ORF Transcript_14990/g.20963 Transcript_14990/m.20963 type:complete len:275 (+) Transcript_14990:98-922(+)